MNALQTKLHVLVGHLPESDLDTRSVTTMHPSELQMVSGGANVTLTASNATVRSSGTNTIRISTKR